MEMIDTQFNLQDLVKFSRTKFHEIDSAIMEVCVEAATSVNKDSAVLYQSYDSLVSAFLEYVYAKFIYSQETRDIVIEKNENFYHTKKLLTPHVLPHVANAIHCKMGNIEIVVNDKLLSLMDSMSVDNLNGIDMQTLIRNLPFNSFKLKSETGFGTYHDKPIHEITIIRTAMTKKKDSERAIIISTPYSQFNWMNNDSTMVKKIYEVDCFRILFNLLVYMANYTDVTLRDSHETFTSTKIKYNKALRIFTGLPKKPLELGYRIGAKLKAYYDQRKTNTNISTTQPETRGKTTVAPHVKRAHWATYYIGPRKDDKGNKIPLEKQTQILRLKAPIFVGFDLTDDLELITTRRDLV